MRYKKLLAEEGAAVGRAVPACWIPACRQSLQRGKTVSRVGS